MSTESQTLGQWVTELNTTLFFQPDDELARRAVEEHIDTSLVVKYVRPHETVLSEQPSLTCVASQNQPQCLHV